MRAACHSSYARQCEKYIPSKFEENQNTLGAQTKKTGGKRKTNKTDQRTTNTHAHTQPHTNRTQ